jgi:hypothetical protein
MSGGELVRYDAMCRAIARAHAVDEVKDIRDKARAIEMYTRMAQNREAERQATEIRLRAERRCGELLRDMLKATGARGTGSNQYRQVPSADPSAPTLADMHISADQSAQWQKLAAIPQHEFEADLADPMWQPTTTGLIGRQEARERGPLPPLQVDDGALWLWGRLQDFERNAAHMIWRRQ